MCIQKFQIPSKKSENRKIYRNSPTKVSIYGRLSRQNYKKIIKAVFEDYLLRISGTDCLISIKLLKCFCTIYVSF